MLYLAYGSNLHPFRLSERVQSVNAVGVAELSGLSLTFHKRSQDGSGKCGFIESSRRDSTLWCAVYELDAFDKARLDELEGLGYGYHEQRMDFRLNGRVYDGSIYRPASTHVDECLSPYHWYKRLVLLGSYYHRFPDRYTDAIAQIESVEDPDEQRAEENEMLLENMRRINVSAGCRIDQP